MPVKAACSRCLAATGSTLPQDIRYTVKGTQLGRVAPVMVEARQEEAAAAKWVAPDARAVALAEVGWAADPSCPDAVRRQGMTTPAHQTGSVHQQVQRVETACDTAARGQVGRGR